MLLSINKICIHWTQIIWYMNLIHHIYFNSLEHFCSQPKMQLILLIYSYQWKYSLASDISHLLLWRNHFLSSKSRYYVDSAMETIWTSMSYLQMMSITSHSRSSLPSTTMNCIQSLHGIVWSSSPIQNYFSDDFEVSEWIHIFSDLHCDNFVFVHFRRLMLLNLNLHFFTIQRNAM